MIQSRSPNKINIDQERELPPSNITSILLHRGHKMIQFFYENVLCRCSPHVCTGDETSVSPCRGSWTMAASTLQSPRSRLAAAVRCGPGPRHLIVLSSRNINQFCGLYIICNPDHVRSFYCSWNQVSN